jgi:hypothetical protein
VLRAAELIEGLACGHVIAERAYDAQHFHDTVLDAGAPPVIPPRPKRAGRTLITGISTRNAT